MTKIHITGTALTLVSEHTMEELRKVSKYQPKATRLQDEDGNAYFFLNPSTNACLTDSIVAYADVAPNGKACLSVLLPKLPAGKTAKDYVAETYGPTIANLNKVEAQIETALSEVNAMLDEIKAGITVADAE